MNHHLDPERLAAYHAGELPLEEAERVQDHLAACRECAGLLLDLDRLADPAFGAEALPEETKEELWRRVAAGIRRDAPAAPAAAVLPMRRRPASSPRWVQALAATLLAAVIGLSLWVASLRRTMDELSRPQLNAPVLDLYTGTVRGEGDGRPAMSVPADARVFTLILNPAGQRSHEEYRVEIAREGGAVVWSGGGLKPNPFGSFSLTLSRSLLDPGDYRIRLFGRSGDSEERIEDYGLRVEGP